MRKTLACTVFTATMLSFLAVRAQQPATWQYSTTDYGQSVANYPGIIRWNPGQQVFMTASDFGCIGDGVHDDTEALRSAFSASANNAPLWIPAWMTIAISGIVQVPDGLNLILDGIIRIIS